MNSQNSPDIYIAAQAKTSTMKNGAIVDTKTFSTNYDGSIMTLKGTDNGKLVLDKKMNNNDIMKLLENPANKISLIERISKDFNIKQPSSRKTKKSSRKTKKTKKTKKIKKSKKSKKSSRKSKKSSRKSKKSSRKSKKSSRK